MRTALAVVVAAVALAGTTRALTTSPSSPTPAAVRAAVERSLPLLQSSADTWFAKRQCSSCHHQSVGVLAVTVARERGFPIDDALVRSQVGRSLRPFRNWHAEYVTGEISINEAIGQSYRAVGIGSAGAARSPITDAVVYLLAGRQHVSGNWPSYSRRPPLEDSEFTATALTIRALRLFPLPGREAELDARIEDARRWLARARPASTEERVMQLFGLGWSGIPVGDVRAMAEALITEQRLDGGWAQIVTRGSDAYATGEVLVALNQVARIPMSDERLQRGLAYLLSTQERDGSWHVPTRRTFRDGLPYFESGYPHGKDQFISFSGAAWATMSLALATRDEVSPALMGQPPARRPVWPESPEPDGLTPLMRAALYGTAAEIDTLLANGADVNETATRGGVTALMCAIRDPAKVGRLLAAGANPDVATESGHTALLLAARYAGAARTVELLLGRRVAVDTPVVNGSLIGITALAGAAMRGDTAVAEMLLSRGAQIDGVVKGKMSPLMSATLHGDAPMVAWLAARGATVNGTLSDDFSNGSTPLMIASEDGRQDVVAELLRRSANVNVLDTDGNSALIYAAMTVDRGTTEIVDRLLEAGADRTITGPHAEPPSALARRWGKPHIANRLDASSSRPSRANQTPH
jgi:ankyrin repeat protein